MSSVDPQDACPLEESFEFQLEALDNIVKMPGLEEEVKELVCFVIDLTLTAVNKCRNYFTTGKSHHNKKHKLVAVELSLPLSLLECLPSSPETHSIHQGVFLLTSLLTASAC